MKKIAIFTEKGGVGKTILSVNTSHALSKTNRKTLLVDLDGQNNSARNFGYTKERIKERKSFYELTDRRNPAKLSEVIYNVRENLDIMFNRKMYQINREITGESQLHKYLFKMFNGIEELGYHNMIIDCGPSESNINTAILSYVDYIIVPVELETFSMEGVSDTFDYLVDIDVDPRKIVMFVPNKLDLRQTEMKEYLEKLQALGEKYNIKVSKPVHSRTIIKKRHQRI